MKSYSRLRLCVFSRNIWQISPISLILNFFLALDTTNNYLVMDRHRSSNTLLSEHIVLNLISPIVNKVHKVTMDSIFYICKTCYKTLIQKKTSIIGTMYRVSREIPPEMKTMKETRYETKIFKHEDAILTVYQGKPSKNILVLSTMHPSVIVRQSTKK